MSSNKQQKWHSLGDFLKAKKQKEEEEDRPTLRSTELDIQTVTVEEDDRFKSLTEAKSGSANHLEAGENNSLLRELSTSLPPPTTSYPLPPPSTKKELVSKVDPAPTRDFTRVANSITRDAVPAGLFKGTSKKLYDALYQRSRGAVVPNREIRAKQSELMAWASVSHNTLREHLSHLKAVGLINVRWELGDNSGAFYEVFLPEEINLEASPSPPPTTSYHHPLPPPPPSTQKLGGPSTQKLVGGGGGQMVDLSATYEKDNTLINTDDDDTHTRALFAAPILTAAREGCGGVLNLSEQEKENWRELGEALAEEYRTAATKAGTVSSPSAFFLAHLRRKLSGGPKEKRKEGDPPAVAAPAEDNTTVSEREVSSAETPTKKPRYDTKEQADHPASGGGKPVARGAKSRFSFNDRRRYAQNQKPPLGNGWLVESDSGKYDELIGVWFKENLEPTPSKSGPDLSECPDCRGTGMYYPSGFEKGAAKCRHEKLVRD